MTIKGESKIIFGGQLMIIENLNQIPVLPMPTTPSINILAAGCCDLTDDNGWDGWMKEGD